MKTIMAAMPLLIAELTLSGCAAGWNALIGKENAEAIDLIIDCRTEAASAKLESSMHSSAARVRRLSLALKAAMHLEAGDDAKAEALYPKIQTDSDSPKPSIESVRSDTLEMVDGFRKERQKKTGNPSC